MRQIVPRHAKGCDNGERLRYVRRAAAVAAVFLSNAAMGQTPVDSAALPRDTTSAILVVPVDSPAVAVAVANCGHPASEVTLRRVGVAAAFVTANGLLYR